MIICKYITKHTSLCMHVTNFSTPLVYSHFSPPSVKLLESLISSPYGILNVLSSRLAIVRRPRWLDVLKNSWPKSSSSFIKLVLAVRSYTFTNRSSKRSRIILEQQQSGLRVPSQPKDVVVNLKKEIKRVAKGELNGSNEKKKWVEFLYVCLNWCLWL